MTVRVLPDTEALGIAYLLTRSEVTDLVATRIGTTLDTTQDTPLPFLRVVRVSAPTVVRRHLRAGNVQLEGWADEDLDAKDLCELAFAAMTEDDASGPVRRWPGLGVITGVDEALGPRSFDDNFTETARWIASVIIYAHPEPQ